jgi:hypothetical protein
MRVEDEGLSLTVPLREGAADGAIWGASELGRKYFRRWRFVRTAYEGAF